MGSAPPASLIGLMTQLTHVFPLVLHAVNPIAPGAASRFGYQSILPFLKLTATWQLACWVDARSSA